MLATARKAPQDGKPGSVCKSLCRGHAGWICSHTKSARLLEAGAKSSQAKALLEEYFANQWPRDAALQRHLEAAVAERQALHFIPHFCARTLIRFFCLSVKSLVAARTAGCLREWVFCAPFLEQSKEWNSAERHTSQPWFFVLKRCSRSPHVLLWTTRAATASSSEPGTQRGRPQWQAPRRQPRLAARAPARTLDGCLCDPVRSLAVVLHVPLSQPPRTLDERTKSCNCCTALAWSSKERQPILP